MKKLLVIFILMLAFISSYSFAVPQPNTFSPQQKKNIEQIVHDYLVSNPQVLVEASQALRKQNQDRAQNMAITAIKKNKVMMFDDALSPMVGNPQGTTTIVEFLDYQCGHCKEMSQIIESLVKENQQLKVIFKDFPIFGANSEYAAKASIAAYKIEPNKYFHFHQALLSAKDPLTQDMVNKIAKQSGYNLTTLQTEIKSTATANQLKKNFMLAKQLGLQGTPALVISDSKQTQIKFFGGAVPKQVLNQIIQTFK